MLRMSGIDFIFIPYVHAFIEFILFSVVSLRFSRCIITESIINDNFTLSSTNFSSCFIALVKVLQTYENSSDSYSSLVFRML